MLRGHLDYGIQSILNSACGSGVAHLVREHNGLTLNAFLKLKYRVSLVVQWLRICLLMQATWV